jgi:hypothetical protein
VAKFIQAENVYDCGSQSSLRNIAKCVQLLPPSQPVLVSIRQSLFEDRKPQTSRSSELGDEWK